MRTIALSNRDVEYFYFAPLTKEAGAVENFVEGFASSALGKLELRKKPFETLFGVLGPMFFAKTLMGRGLLYVAESYGFGLSLIGKYIDDLLVSSGTGDSISLTAESLMDAAKKLVNKILGFLGIKSLANGQRLQIIKEAGPFSRRRRSGILSFFNKASRGGRLNPVNLIYKILFAFASGLGFLGVIGGVKSVLFGPEGKETTNDNTGSGTDSPKASKLSEPPPGVQYYSNVNNDVERTLITFIDAAVDKIKQRDGTETNFSGTFNMMRGYSLLGSEQMKKVLKDVEQLNDNSSIEDVSNKPAFFGPSVRKMVSYLMPEATVEKIDKSPTRKKQPQRGVSNRQKLERLLKGVV